MGWQPLPSGARQRPAPPPPPPPIPRYMREVRRVQAFGSNGPEPVDLVTYSDGEVHARRIDVSNIDDPQPSYLRSVAPGQFELVMPPLDENEKLRCMLRADALPLVPFVPQPGGYEEDAPRMRFRDRAPVIWLCTFVAALYRELYGPAHLRRYL